MMTVWMILVGVVFVVTLVRGFVDLHLVTSLKDFYPDVYARAGSPPVASFLASSMPRIGWLRYVMLRRFAADASATRELRSAFEASFVCAWLTYAIMASFMVYALSKTLLRI